ncbi:MAG: response regulator transcription factor [Actinomycetota bacterium]
MPYYRVTGLVPVPELLTNARRVQGDLIEAQEALLRLKDAASRIGTAPVRALCKRVEGQLAAAGGEHDRARTLLEDAVDGFRHCDAVYDAACAAIDLAATLLALDRKEESGREAAAAVEALDRMGAEIEVERGRRLMSSAGSGLNMTVSKLTGRERQVLALVAQGCTNRTIADRLVVSEHTVHRHVTNILRKLDLSSRTAAAAWAIRHEPPAE